VRTWKGTKKKHRWVEEGLPLPWEVCIHYCTQVLTGSTCVYTSYILFHTVGTRPGPGRVAKVGRGGVHHPCKGEQTKNTGKPVVGGVGLKLLKKQIGTFFKWPVSCLVKFACEWEELDRLVLRKMAGLLMTVASQTSLLGVGGSGGGPGYSSTLRGVCEGAGGVCM